MNTIYALYDPRDGAYKYVGKTRCSLNRRLVEHISTARDRLESRPVYQWIRSLLCAGVRPEIEALEQVPDESAAQKEREWFDRLKNSCKLHNASAPGASCSAGRALIMWTPEALSRLGKDGDAEIAKDLGCCRESVVYRRELLGIPPAPIMGLKQRGVSRIKPQLTEIPQEALELLGKMADRKLAAKFNLTREVVRLARRRRGIPSVTGVLTEIPVRDGVAERAATERRRAERKK